MREFNAAALAAYESAWAADRVHRIGEVPTGPRTPYAVLSVSSGAAVVFSGDGTSRARSYRVVVQAFGRTYDEVAFAVEKADATFLDKSLTVAGYDVTPPHPNEVVSSQVIRDPDGGGLLMCTLIYPITAYPSGVVNA